LRAPLPPDTSDGAPWKQRYRARRIAHVSVAPHDRRHGMVIHNGTGTLQAYAWDLTSGTLSQLTHAATGTVLAHLVADGTGVLFVQDQGGNEVGHWVRVPFSGGTAQDLTPSMAPYSSWTVAASPDGSAYAIAVAGDDGTSVLRVESNDPDEPSTPNGVEEEAAPLVHVKGLVLDQVFSADGSFLAMLSSEPTGSNTYALVALDARTGEEIGRLWDGPPSSVTSLLASPVPGDARVAGTSDVSGRPLPFVWDVQTGDRRDLSSPESGAITLLDWSEDGDRLLLWGTDRAVARVFVYDLKRDEIESLDHGVSGHATLVGPGGGFGPDGEIVVLRDTPRAPSEVVGLSNEAERVLVPATDVPAGRPWRSVSFPSSDGAPIQGWLCSPDGEGPFPTVLSVHGGPESVTTEAYSPFVLAWVDHGYAVLCLNYRGSITFGREFQQQIWGDLGHWEIEDMAAAAGWLVDTGVAQPRGVLLSGGSYGGYLTLLGLGRRPDLWAGGVAEVAVADWVGMYEETADTLRAYQEQIFGGAPDAVPDLYRRASPITYVEALDAPLLVFQGSNDTRCPPGQFRGYEERARDLGKDIEVEWFEAGHIGPDLEDDIAFQERALSFAHRVFAGRSV
jgi:WD40 repeat protein